MTDPTPDQLRAVADHLAPVFDDTATTKELEADPLYVVARYLRQKATAADVSPETQPAGWYVLVAEAFRTGEVYESEPEEFDEPPTTDDLDKLAGLHASEYVGSSWYRVDDPNA